MTERPILFNGEMVRAVLEGRKTQTRRIFKMPYSSKLWEPWKIDSLGVITSSHPKKGKFGMLIKRPLQKDDKRFERDIIVCPYGAISDELWVREGWAADVHFDNMSPSDIPVHNCWYSASVSGAINDAMKGRNRTSIHMPRWVSRIQLRIIDVRVERLQDISEDDAAKEGVTLRGSGHITHRDAFAKLWDSINGADEIKSWNANPFVWVIEFEKVKK